MNRLTVLLIGGLLASCATSPPRTTTDVCAIFGEQDDWYAAARRAEGQWNVPVSVQMAIMNTESAFVADARPPRHWLFGFIPLGRPTSAYGYAQAIDATWDRYREATGNGGADRDDFADATDFIGWYVNESRRQLGIPASDAYRQYLAYHEGQGGYRRGSYRAKPAVRKAARQVAAQAKRYSRQLNGCREALADEE